MEHDPAELRELLERGLSELGVVADSSTLDRWVQLARLLERWSQRINLTGHRGELAIARRLLLESAALSQVLPAAATIADLGSGAGIPGLPLAICRPASQIWLVESRERRHHFQRAAIRELGLANAVALYGRAEDLDARQSEGVISQAFASPDLALRWMRPWALPAGWIAIATSADLVDPRQPRFAGGELVSYAAPGGPPRVVWISGPRAAPLR